MERSAWTLILLAAIGFAAIVLALVPSAWPNPLVRDGAVVEARVVPTLRTAAQAVDAACRRGDAAAFSALTSDAYREKLTARLAAFDVELDAQVLRRVVIERGYADWLRRDRPVLATAAREGWVAVAIDRGVDEAGAHDGAQVLAFAWDGEQFVLDEVRHAARVRNAEVARRYLAEWLRLR
jgi:hypothetical protein